MPIERGDVLAFDLDNIDDVLAMFRQEVIDDLSQSLREVDRVSTGELVQSIRVDLPHRDNIISFELYMEDYWKFVDKGVDGTKRKWGSPFRYKKKNINQRAALDFIANRGITQWKNKEGKVVFDVKAKPKERKLNAFNKASKKTLANRTKTERYKTLAFLVGRSISMFGVKPTNFYTDVINDKWKEEFQEKVSKALKKDVTIVFKDIFNGNNDK